MAAKIMKPKERQAVIVEYLKNSIGSVDVLDKNFVDHYIEKTGVDFRVQFFGSDTCKQLGRDLSAMYKSGILARATIGLPGIESGFPKWVYCYSLHKDINYD